MPVQLNSSDADKEMGHKRQREVKAPVDHQLIVENAIVIYKTNDLKTKCCFFLVMFCVPEGGLLCHCVYVVPLKSDNYVSRIPMNYPVERQHT